MPFTSIVCSIPLSSTYVIVAISFVPSMSTTATLPSSLLDASPITVVANACPISIGVLSPNTSSTIILSTPSGRSNS